MLNCRQQAIASGTGATRRGRLICGGDTLRGSGTRETRGFMAQKSLVGRFFRAIWNLFNVIRKVVFGLAALGLVLVMLAGIMSGGDQAIVHRGAALVLMPEGNVVEQYAGDPVDLALARMLDRQIPETRQRDLLEAIRRATNDQRIGALVIVTNEMRGIGLSKLQELRHAIEAFKATDRPVIAYGDSFMQHHYYLAAAADEVYMNPQGLVFMQGYSVYPTYYKEGMDKLELDVHVFRVGEYKSAVEPFLRNSMSEEAKEASMQWLESLWTAYRDDIAEARDLNPDAIDDYVWRYAEHLRANGGSGAKTALQAGLIDHISSRDEVEADLIELVGKDSNGSFLQIDFQSYLQITDAESILRRSANRVGVVVARGIIQDGDQPQGVIGATSIIRLIRRAREDDDIKAVVLRVDSPGGSIFASDVIRREIELTRDSGKPVVVSMSSLATSGGYWISMDADEIWANPTTLTGSIGIFGLFPSYSRTIAKIGIHVDGVGTSPLAGSLRADRPLQPELGDAIQTIVEHGYHDFINKVAAARGKTPEEIDAIARGRVWSGQDAFDLGLVDRLGGFYQAVASAAEKAGISDDYDIQIIERELTFTERLLMEWSTITLGWAGIDLAARLELPFDDLVGASPTLAAIQRDVRTLIETSAPYGVFSYCFCTHASE